MTATATEVACPKCGGSTWDNRNKKTNPKAPDFKCKDRSCDGVIWPPRQAQRPQARPAAPQAPPAEYGDIPGVPMAAPTPAPAATGPDRLQRIFRVQEACFAHALKMAQQAATDTGVETTLEGVSALTAQALIQFFGGK